VGERRGGDGGERDSVAAVREGAGPSKRPPGVSARPPSPSMAGGAPANYRIAFAAVWIAVQAILVVTADRRMTGPFDFRPTNESTAMKLVLEREVNGPDGRPMRVHVDDGGWSARGRDGRYHRQIWYDRVPIPVWVFDRETPVSHEQAELTRLQSALDDVVTHVSLDDDVETRRLFLDVSVRKNGHDPVVHTLTSRERGIDSLRDGGP
jgi:hypothetical protein